MNMQFVIGINPNKVTTNILFYWGKPNSISTKGINNLTWSWKRIFRSLAIRSGSARIRDTTQITMKNMRESVRCSALFVGKITRTYLKNNTFVELLRLEHASKTINNLSSAMAAMLKVLRNTLKACRDPATWANLYLKKMNSNIIITTNFAQHGSKWPKYVSHCVESHRSRHCAHLAKKFLRAFLRP